MITVKLAQPNSLYIEFDTGMTCYVTADAPLKFDFNWLEGMNFAYELAKPAIKRHVQRLTREAGEGSTGVVASRAFEGAKR